MPTVTAIVTIVPEEAANARRCLAESAVVQRASSCPWVMMLCDYSGSQRGEALSRASSAGHLVNEFRACGWRPRLERQELNTQLDIVLVGSHTHKRTCKCKVSMVHCLVLHFLHTVDHYGEPAERTHKTSSWTLSTHLVAYISHIFWSQIWLTAFMCWGMLVIPQVLDPRLSLNFKIAWGSAVHVLITLLWM